MNWICKQIYKLSFFRNLKIEITSELYLSSIINRKYIYISIIAKFQCSSHGLAIETGRHCHNVIHKEEWICLYCSKFQNNYVTECEFHFLMQCPAYDDLQNKYQVRDINETCTKAAGLFLHYAFIVHHNIISLL